MARANLTTVTGTILTVEHAGTSRMGNPTYRIILTDGRTFLTETNGSVGYSASNYARHSSETTERVNTLHIGARGKVTRITGPDRSDALRSR